MFMTSWGLVNNDIFNIKYNCIEQLPIKLSPMSITTLDNDFILIMTYFKSKVTLNTNTNYSVLIIIIHYINTVNQYKS